MPKDTSPDRFDGGQAAPQARGLFRWGLFGCFGLLAATGVLIVIVSLVVALNR